MCGCAKLGGPLYHPFNLMVNKRWTNTPPRYGAVGKHGSIAVVERAIRTLKSECTRKIHVFKRHKDFRSELVLFVA